MGRKKFVCVCVRERERERERESLVYHKDYINLVSDGWMKEVFIAQRHSEESSVQSILWIKAVSW